MPQCLQLDAKTAELASLQEQFRQLKEDFLHNEGILHERDEELAAYEASLRNVSQRLAQVEASEQSAVALSSSLQGQAHATQQECVAGFSHAISSYCMAHPV